MWPYEIYRNGNFIWSTLMHSMPCEDTVQEWCLTASSEPCYHVKGPFHTESLRLLYFNIKIFQNPQTKLGTISQMEYNCSDDNRKSNPPVPSHTYHSAAFRWQAQALLLYLGVAVYPDSPREPACQILLWLRLDLWPKRLLLCPSDSLSSDLWPSP